MITLGDLKRGVWVKCPHRGRKENITDHDVPMEICVDTSPLRGRGVWGNEVSPRVDTSPLLWRGVWGQNASTEGCGVKENRRFSTSETHAFGGQCPH